MSFFLQALHGSHTSNMRHAGDFGNILADTDGIAIVDIIVNSESTLFGENSLIGRTLVIHSDEDDLGLIFGDEDSQSTGNAGSRLACGIINQPGALSQWDLTLIIIIVLAVVIVLLLIFITCLIIYCCRK
jgi:hypothetical protein